MAIEDLIDNSYADIFMMPRKSAYKLPTHSTAHFKISKSVPKNEDFKKDYTHRLKTDATSQRSISSRATTPATPTSYGNSKSLKTK